MKKRNVTLAIIYFLSFIFASTVSAADIYKIDPNHSYVLWHISHFDFTHFSGKWMVTEGTITLDKDNPQNSNVKVTIHVANVVTGIPK